MPCQHCTQPSVLSRPPRKLWEQRRRSKAHKAGLPINCTTSSSSTHPPIPTLASTRAHRTVPEVGYTRDKDGNYHIIPVRRNPIESGPTPPVPYLTGQDDIPWSDSESDSESEDGNLDAPITSSSISTLPNSHTSCTLSLEDEYDLVDEDAEGEDEDIVMKECEDPAPPNQLPCPHPQVAHPFTNPLSVIENNFLYQPIDLLCGASEEDMRALFGGLDAQSVTTEADADKGPFGYGNWQSEANNLASVSFCRAFSDLTDPSRAHGEYAQNSFAMHQMNATVHDIAQPHHPSLPMQPSCFSPASYPNNGAACQPQTGPFGAQSTPPSQLSAMVVAPHPSSQSGRIQYPPLHVPTSRPADAHQSPTPLCSQLSRPALHLSTRELVAQVRAQARAQELPRPLAPTSPVAHPRLNSPRPIRPTPLQELLETNIHSHTAETGLSNIGEESDRDDLHEDSDRSRPSTPLDFEDTDIGLTDSLSGPHERAVQARSRATRWPNIHVQERPTEARRTPTLLEIEENARSLYRKSRRRNRSGRAIREPIRNRNILPAGALTEGQQEVMPPMEYHVLNDVWCINPWPEDRMAYLQDARMYAENITGISDDSVFTRVFLDTVFYRTSTNRGSPLMKILCMMEYAFKVSNGDRNAIAKLVHKNLFLYSSINRNPDEYFRVGALGDAIEIILFKSPKPVGVAFLHKFAELDDPVKCASWHRKAKDKTARRGVPPGLIALAATQMYWALEKMYLGTTLHFDEQHYRQIWNRYFRDLLNLQHLGKLRTDLLHRLQDYYMDHFSAEEEDYNTDSDEASMVRFPAW